MLSQFLDGERQGAEVDPVGQVQARNDVGRAAQDVTKEGGRQVLHRDGEEVEQEQEVDEDACEYDQTNEVKKVTTKG